MIGLGLACSHAPMAFQESAEEWDSYYYGMHDMSGRPRPKEADRETYDVDRRLHEADQARLRCAA